jgi:hypothetical protein
MGSSLAVDNTATVKTDWKDINPEIAEEEEVQLRIICSGGNGEAELGISTLRLQVR